MTLVWGEEGGGSSKPVVERHVQAEIRAIVSPCPYSEVARTTYAEGWRTEAVSLLRGAWGRQRRDGRLPSTKPASPSAIVGGGIGGLSAALSLLARGSTSTSTSGPRR